MDDLGGRDRLAAVLDLRRAMLIARSEAHADQYDTRTLQWALPLLGEPQQQAIVRRVLDRRTRGQTSRISG